MDTVGRSEVRSTLFPGLSLGPTDPDTGFSPPTVQSQIQSLRYSHSCSSQAGMCSDSGDWHWLSMNQLDGSRPDPPVSYTDWTPLTKGCPGLVVYISWPVPRLIPADQTQCVVVAAILDTPRSTLLPLFLPGLCVVHTADFSGFLLSKCRDFFFRLTCLTYCFFWISYIVCKMTFLSFFSMVE